MSLSCISMDYENGNFPFTSNQSKDWIIDTTMAVRAIFECILPRTHSIRERYENREWKYYYLINEKNIKNSSDIVENSFISLNSILVSSYDDKFCILMLDIDQIPNFTPILFFLARFFFYKCFQNWHFQFCLYFLSAFAANNFATVAKFIRQVFCTKLERNHPILPGRNYQQLGCQAYTFQRI